MNKKNNKKSLQKKSLQDALPVIIPLTVCVLLVGIAMGSTDTVTSEQMIANPVTENRTVVELDSI